MNEPVPYQLQRTILVIAGLSALVIILGTAGYMVIEGWTLVDSLYMTIITMTTIGYGEVKPLSPLGRFYTIGLIIIGVATASYALTATVNLLTSPNFVRQIRAYRSRKRLNKISQHTIICGFGRMGRNLARELLARNQPIIVIDLDEAAIERCQTLGVPAVHGNAADEEVLYAAGINRASSLVAAANSDAENVFIVLTARGLNPNLRIITRCNSEASISKLEKAGADTVISPYITASRRIAQMLLRPNVVNFLDGILEFGDHKIRLEEFIIDKDSPLAGLTLKEARLKVAVLAVTHPDHAELSHPNAETRLLPGAGIVVMGVEEELQQLAELVKGRSKPASMPID
ncbi:MAG: potassium channel protein [Chloroflexi bacterium]|nr:MAG: potassium channel protein [Chloroflexota bacterium]